MEFLITILTLIGLGGLLALVALIVSWGYENRNMKLEKEQERCENCVHCDAVYQNWNIICNGENAKKPIYCKEFERKT